MNNLTIKDQTREQIAAFLPEALRIALNSYQEYALKKEFSKPAEFKDHHTACKVAIAHIELLLKLARIADLPDKDQDLNDKILLVATLNEAEEELNGFEDITVEYEVEHE